MASYTLTLPEQGAVEITVSEHGEGKPYLLLHGGAGPQSVAGFAQLLAALGRVYAPSHPGFAGTQRPEWLASIGGLAALYVALIEQLDLDHVTVVGSSIGGWIAAEMALRKSSRIDRIILIDAVGIVVEGQGVADIFSLSLPEIAALSYHNPAVFLIPSAAPSDEEKRIMGGNRAALAVYGGQPPMTDPTLAQRLGAVETPTLVLWGESDGVVSPAYGQAYAEAIPGATFQLLPSAGHMPQLETPDQVLAAIRSFAQR